MIPRLVISRFRRFRNCFLVGVSECRDSEVAVSGWVASRKAVRWGQGRRSWRGRRPRGFRRATRCWSGELVMRASRPFSVVSVTIFVPAEGSRRFLLDYLPSNDVAGQRVGLLLRYGYFPQFTGL